MTRRVAPDPPRAARAAAAWASARSAWPACWRRRRCLRPAPAADASTRSRRKPPHFPGKAKRVIHLFMNGGPSQVDTFDPKPALDEVRTASRCRRRTSAPSARPAAALPLAVQVPEVRPERHRGQRAVPARRPSASTTSCVIRSMHADVPNHEPSLMLMNCGDARLVRPEHGLVGHLRPGHARTRTCPASSPCAPAAIPIQESQNWQSAFLPGVYQGTYIDTQHTDDREADREHPQHATLAASEQRRQLDLLAAAQRAAPASRAADDAQLEARIQSFELAYRMQMEAADAFDVSREPQHVREMYGDGIAGAAAADRPPAARARRALRAGLARRRASRGTTTTTSKSNHRKLAARVRPGRSPRLLDRPEAARPARRHAGDLGRRVRPHADGRAADSRANAGKINGRDHNHYGFTMWLAGGGVKGGHVHGATDEFGFQAVENKVHVHDLHATHPAPARLRPREAHLPLRRPRLPPDRRARQRRQGDPGLTNNARGTEPPAAANFRLTNRGGDLSIIRPAKTSLT